MEDDKDKEDFKSPVYPFYFNRKDKGVLVPKRSYFQFRALGGIVDYCATGFISNSHCTLVQLVAGNLLFG